MHELAFVESIFNEIEAAREKMGIREKITRVELEVGDLTGAVPRSLEFCFDALKGNTPLAEAELLIRRVPGTLRCLQCEDTGAVDLFPTVCPSCGSADVRITGGDELRIVSIEIDQGEREG